MSSDAGIAIRVRDLSKRYQIYADPSDRLKQSIVPRLQRAVGLRPKQYYRDFWALHDVSFDVRRGETVGIVGKNGAGKSTLLHLIVGTHEPTAGTVEVHGRVTSLLELGSGFHPLFTGRENVYLNAAIIGMPREEIDRRFDEIAGFADIGMFIDQPVNTYSSGMYLRLAFAVQVCLDPDILVVDEALAVGDAYFVHRCFHRIRRMKEQGKTILFVTHDTAAVNNLCDRAMWINEGRLVSEGRPDDVTALYRADLFKVQVQQEQVPAAAAPVAPAAGGRAPEGAIPNCDRRLGSQDCRIAGIGLYDGEGRERLAAVQPGAPVTLRITVANERVPQGTPLVVGYELFTPRGENLGGVNTQVARFEVAAPAPGSAFTIRARVELPPFRHGHYAITPAVASQRGDELRIEDRIENALVFEVLGAQDAGWMRFPTAFQLE